MKANLALFLHRKMGLLVAGLSLSTWPLQALSSPESRLAITPASSGNAVSVTINDAGNNLWVFQSSTNLGIWADTEILKVYNGSFHRTFSPTPDSPYRFFRASFDPALADIPDTTANALLLPATSFNYSAPFLPPNFLVPPIVNQDNTPATNATTDAGSTLGRVLFYDKRLSTNQTIACASCHQQQHGFADPRRFSSGFNGGLTGRNSMGLTQARYYPRGHFFWDERAATLEDQVLQPIQNSVEMGMTLPALEARLNAEPFYTNLFNQT